MQCDVAKYSYVSGDPKYRSAPMIVAPWYLWWKALSARDSSLCLLSELCYGPENCHVSTAVDKNEQTQGCSTLHIAGVFLLSLLRLPRTIQDVEGES